MSETWRPRDAYEVVVLGTRRYGVLVRGGHWSRHELAFEVIAETTDRDEAFAIRDAMRATLPQDEQP